jgi:predicted nucleic acid-binding Zn finger protein
MTVTPILFERLTFTVTSEVAGRPDYRVDLEWNHGLGGCDCADYEKRAKEKSKQTCKHIRAALKYHNETQLRSCQ